MQENDPANSISDPSTNFHVITFYRIEEFQRLRKLPKPQHLEDLDDSSCPLCATYDLTAPGELMQHMQFVHKEYELACDFCETYYGMSQMSELFAHLRKFHPDEPRVRIDFLIAN